MFLSSRIPQRLRESEGMSYGAGSSLRANFKYPASRWTVYAIFNPIFKNRLDSALREEINIALRNGFRQEEFKTTVTAWLQGRQTGLGLDQELVGRLTTYLEEGKDLSFFTEYEEKVKKLTVSEVNAALRKYISPEKISFIYAGDFEKK